MPDKKIKIEKDGPYVVTGGVPISEQIIVPVGRGYVLREGRRLPQDREYRLCRCGKSKNQPFCDDAHEGCDFDGTETASRRPYDERIASELEGPDLTLQDDRRCAFLRFCHRNSGSVWELTRRSDDPGCREEAILAAYECPAGRLTAADKEGRPYDQPHPPAIEILQDPERGVSGPIYVKGGIPIESADGSMYPAQNRVTLCRCGASRNMPFCDAGHVTVGFDDGAVPQIPEEGD